MTATPRDPSIEPDTRDWTWVLDRACPDCGFDARAVRPADVTTRVDANARGWRSVLASPGVAVRPTPAVWSRLEYGCHVRDVHRVFAARVRSMLESDDPLFDNWDQDATAVLEAYGEQDPTTVADELVSAAADATELYGSVQGEQWDRSGRRSNGSTFTVLSLARYHLHDVVHHLWDVSLT